MQIIYYSSFRGRIRSDRGDSGVSVPSAPVDLERWETLLILREDLIDEAARPLHPRFASEAKGSRILQYAFSFIFALRMVFLTQSDRLFYRRDLPLSDPTTCSHVQSGILTRGGSSST